jgi:hypothetical protein
MNSEELTTLQILLREDKKIKLKVREEEASPKVCVVVELLMPVFLENVTGFDS